jgi:hypothetical protein
MTNPTEPTSTQSTILPPKEPSSINALLDEPTQRVWYRHPVFWLGVLALVLAVGGGVVLEGAKNGQWVTHLHHTGGSARQPHLEGDR